MTDAEIVSAMMAVKEAGIYKVEVDFSGSGDSGDIDEWRYYNEEGDEFDVDNNSVVEIIKMIGNQIINAHYSYDWYNNEGGRGTLHIDFVEKEWDIEGVQYVEEPNSESGDLTTIVEELNIYKK
jgi:hypothetical protein